MNPRPALKAGLVLGVLVLSVLSLALPLTTTYELDEYGGRFADVYMGDDPKLYIILADLAFMIALTTAALRGDDTWTRRLAWPFAVFTLPTLLVAGGLLSGGHPGLGGIAVIVEVPVRLATLVVLLTPRRSRQPQ
ncbi:hypothetical protein [Saccharothrix variisporea]|uniref:Uncharacterized protein n=1 Tax=Saccharothrix variisporea TaxID=543527 RepID=A0A495XJT7_9PSEU|nr:hypothetical protein [Saccharothrix variisporea]RKT74791.1 hypothetical protein DFJ66_8162 [Saccharothrix variisporea]